jgi:hypothetical protein
MLLRKTFLFVCIGWVLASVSESHDDSATQPVADTPKGAWIRWDSELPAGGIKAAKAPYYTASAMEDRVAESFAESDLARAFLNEVIRKNFGVVAAKEVTHAAGQWTVEDARAAKVIERGKDRVDLQFSNGELLPIVRVQGAWRVSVKELLQQVPVDPVVWRKVNHESATVYSDVQRELHDGKLKDVEAVKRALADRLAQAAKNGTSK